MICQNRIILPAKARPSQRPLPQSRSFRKTTLMKENCALITKTKIQNLLRLACDVYNNENRRTEERLLKESVNQIKLLRIRLAYECGRDPQVRQFVESANLFEYLAKLSSVGTCTRQDLIDYYHYMEALVAFHRYYSESKTGEENAS